MEFMPCLFKRILMIFHNNFNSPWESYTMFDLSLSLKILTAYPIYYVDKSTQNQWRSHLQSNVPPERSLSRLKSRYEGLYTRRRQCWIFFFFDPYKVYCLHLLFRRFAFSYTGILFQFIQDFKFVFVSEKPGRRRPFKKANLFESYIHSHERRRLSS